MTENSLDSAVDIVIKISNIAAHTLLAGGLGVSHHTDEIISLGHHLLHQFRIIANDAVAFEKLNKVSSRLKLEITHINDILASLAPRAKRGTGRDKSDGLEVTEQLHFFNSTLFRLLLMLLRNSDGIL